MNLKTEEDKLSKVTILLKSKAKISFFIKTKDKEKIAKTLIKVGEIRILDYDFVAFEGIKGNVVVNRSQVDAFIITDIDDSEELR